MTDHQSLNQVEFQQKVDEKVTTSPRGEETVLHLTPSTIHDSVGCDHYFIQKSAQTAECSNCSLGIYLNDRVKKRVELHSE